MCRFQNKKVVNCHSLCHNLEMWKFLVILAVIKYSMLVFRKCQVYPQRFQIKYRILEHFNQTLYLIEKIIQVLVLLGSWVLIGSWVFVGLWVLIGSRILLGPWVPLFWYAMLFKVFCFANTLTGHHMRPSDPHYRCSFFKLIDYPI